MKDGVANNSWIYLNGTIVASSLGGSTADLGVIRNFHIGASGFPANNPETFYAGLIDNFQIYDTALTAGQIQILANNPNAVILENVDDIQLVDSSGDFNGTPVVTQTIPGTAPQAHLNLDTAVISEELAGTDQAQLLIRVVGVDGPTQISVDKNVLNGSGIDWAAFAVDVQENPDADNLQGDPTFSGAQDSSGNFSGVNGIGTEHLDFVSGLLADGDSSALWLGINIPGANGIDPVSGLPSYEFLITQQATAVPEPASIAIWSLLGLILTGFGYFRIRRKK